MIENIADKVPRLRRLVKVAGDHVCLELDLWVRPERGEAEFDVEWTLWDGRTHFRGATVDEAIHAAELAHEIVKAEVPESVILPGAEACGRVEEGR